jgi:hypothetical protein
MRFFVRQGWKSLLAATFALSAMFVMMGCDSGGDNGAGTTAAATYPVTVSSAGAGAAGSGSYAAGATVIVDAGSPPSGQRFKNWTTASNGVTFANANSAATTFTMPANAVTVTAVFEVQSGEDTSSTLYAVTVLSAGTGATVSGSYAVGATVFITAGVSPSGQQFKNWTTASTGVIFANANSAATAFTMPANAVTVTAVFEAISNGNDFRPQYAPPVEAEPFAASNTREPKVLYSWRDGNKNRYIIDAGYIKKMFVSQIASAHYIGIPMSFEKTTSTTTTNTLTRNMTETVSNSVVFSTSTSQKTTLDATVKSKIKIVGDFSVGIKLEESITDNISTTKSTSTNIGYILTATTTESNTEKLSFTIGNHGEDYGHYRYALFAVSDVYFVISTDINNQELLDWDVVSCVRDGDYTPFWEYSPDGKFDNSPTSGQIEFADDFYKRLPKPKEIEYTLAINTAENGTVSRDPNLTSYNAGMPVTVTAKPNDGYKFDGWIGAPSGVDALNAVITFPMTGNLTLTPKFRRKVEKKEIKTFNGNISYTTPQASFPMTIEVYALGAGGGGQGGHKYAEWFQDHYGTGGAGGGGAVAYAKFNVDKATEFTITVGKGGSGGGGTGGSALGFNEAGRDGERGGSTTVKWDGNTITVEGGEGGNGGKDLIGGSGGTAASKPSVVTDDWSSKKGDNGGGGQKEGNAGLLGGKSGELIGVGSKTSYGGASGGTGGAGGYGDNSGAKGDDGEVVIVVVWYE